jgi:hypothetical protein
MKEQSSTFYRTLQKKNLSILSLILPLTSKFSQTFDYQQYVLKASLQIKFFFLKSKTLNLIDEAFFTNHFSHKALLSQDKQGLKTQTKHLQCPHASRLRLPGQKAHIPN